MSSGFVRECEGETYAPPDPLRRTKKGALWGAFRFSQANPAQLPVALSMLTDTPGPIVELIDTFCM